ncbi:MAG: hypothetical protein Q8K37_07115, partial [Alphaproteobacteria bacterium]|nr:hypothetical protein [Alphaproteobacteria bacterium]
KELWTDPEIKELHHESLSNMFIDFLQHIKSSKDNNYIDYIISELLNCIEIKKTTKDKLIHVLFLMCEQLDINIKSFILKALCNYKELRRTHCIKIANFLFTLPEYKGNNAQFNILKELWTDPETKKLHHKALSNMFISFLNNKTSSKDTNYIYYIIQELLNYPEIQKFTKYQLIYLFLDHIQKNSIIEENYKTFIEVTKNEEILKNNKSVLIKIFKKYIKKSLNIEELKNKFNTEGNTVRYHFLRNTDFDGFNSFLKNIYIPRIDAYIMFGHPFQKTYNQFMLYFWPIMNNDLKRTLCENIIRVFGAENPRVQELLFLYARENIDEKSPALIFANLLKKLKEPYTHNLSIQDATLIKNGNEEILHATINPEIFSYLPISQDALTSLDDVDAILGDLNTIENEELRNIIKKVRSDHEFQSYFMAPFSEEAIMLQAMIKKFKEMKEDGKERLITVMHQMHQCKKGKNQAIWDHYSIESKLLFTADLKTITDWLMRLRHIPEENLPAPYKTKSKWVDLINMIIKQDHIFRRHLTDFQTEDAQSLKGLLGYLRYLEQDIDPANHDQLNKNLKNVLEVLVQLSNPDDFYQNLTKLCNAYKIYLPANKFGDHLSINSINVLIQNLKEKDIN